MTHETVSALMAVWTGTPADLLRAALESLREQSRTPDETVVVVDGPLSREHELVLAGFADIERVNLPANVGLGRALAAGLDRCTGEWVARADADDVNLPERLEVQLKVLKLAGADLCAASMREVTGPLLATQAIRHTPLRHQQFARRLRIVNPVNHPTVVFRRETAVRVGGYRHLPLLEDYDLWARMLVDGALFVGVDTPLVLHRVDGVLERRTDKVLARSERELRRSLRDYGVIGPVGAVRHRAVRALYRHSPRALRSLVHRRVLARPVAVGE